MKKSLFITCISLAGCLGANAQHVKSQVERNMQVSTAPANNINQQATPAKATTLTPENLAFNQTSHDFGNVTEGSPAECVFTFTNTGKEPIIINKVQPSCGCTIPDWSKEPIMPGKTGIVKASYGTQGRPGEFTKSMTVMSNAGANSLTIHGNVEKAPTTSVPENNSMMRTAN